MILNLYFFIFIMSKLGLYCFISFYISFSILRLFTLTFFLS